MSTVRHFEVDPGAPSYRYDRETEFLIRETRRVSLTARATSTLTEHREHVHLSEAGPAGARGIDITTDYVGDGSFSFLAFDRNKAEAAAGRVYRALWVGSKIQTSQA